MIDDSPTCSPDESLLSSPIDWQGLYTEAKLRISVLDKQVKELEHTKTQLSLDIETQRASHNAYVGDLNSKRLKLQAAAEQMISKYADLEALKASSEQSWIFQLKEAESSKTQEAQKLTIKLHEVEETRANEVQSYVSAMEELRKSKESEISSLHSQLDEVTKSSDAKLAELTLQLKQHQTSKAHELRSAQSKIKALEIFIASEISQISTRVDELETSNSYHVYDTRSDMIEGDADVSSVEQLIHPRTKETSEQIWYPENNSLSRTKMNRPELPTPSEAAMLPDSEVFTLTSNQKDIEVPSNELNCNSQKRKRTPEREVETMQKTARTAPTKMLTRSQTKPPRETASDNLSCSIGRSTRSKSKGAPHFAVANNSKPKKRSVKTRTKRAYKSPALNSVLSSVEENNQKVKTSNSPQRKNKSDMQPLDTKRELNDHIPKVRESENVESLDKDGSSENDNPLAPCADLQDWQWESQRSICDSICPELQFNEKFLELDTSDLTDNVKFLHSAKTPLEIATAFESVCNNMTEVIDILYTTRRDESVDGRLQYSIKRRKTRNSSGSSKPETELKICESVEHTICRLTNSLLSFPGSEDSGHMVNSLGAKSTIVKSCIRLFNSIIDGIYLSTAEILSSQNAATCYDLRNGFSHTISAFFMRLRYNTQVEQDILEAAMYIVLEAIGKCFAVEKDEEPTYIPDPSPNPAQLDNHRSNKFKSLALRETAGYIRLMLKGILPRFKQFVDKCGVRGELSDIAKKRCHEAIMFGVFGSDMEIFDNLGESSEQITYLSPVLDAIGRGKNWGGVSVDSEFERVDPKFANEIWKMLGLESQ